jgi:peptidylprolyl isomerase
VRSTLKAAAAALAACLITAGCSGAPEDSESPAPLVKASVTVKEAELPTLSGAAGEQPTIAFPLKEGGSSPSPTPSLDALSEEALAQAIEEADAEAAEEADGDAGEDSGDGAEGGDETPAETEPTADAEPSASATPSEPPSPYITPPSSLQAQVQPGMEGDGDAAKAENIVSVNWVAWEWGETEPLPYANSYTDGQPLVFALRSDNTILVGLSRVVVGQKVGSRVMGVIPPSVGSLASAIGVDEGATLVVAVDILEQFDKGIQAQSDATPTNAKIGPQINGALGGPATVSIPGGLAAPEEISLTVVATGTGREVADGDQILVHYSATDWAGKNAGDTWEQGWGPQAATVMADPMGDRSQLLAFSQLVGVPVGSRVLILTPGKEGSYLADAIVLDIVAWVSGEEPAEEPEESEEEPEDGAEEPQSPSPSASEDG